MSSSYYSESKFEVISRTIIGVTWCLKINYGLKKIQ